MSDPVSSVHHHPHHRSGAPSGRRQGTDHGQRPLQPTYGCPSFRFFTKAPLSLKYENCVFRSLLKWLVNSDLTVCQLQKDGLFHQNPLASPQCLPDDNGLFLVTRIMQRIRQAISRQRLLREVGVNRRHCSRSCTRIKWPLLFQTTPVFQVVLKLSLYLLILYQGPPGQREKLKLRENTARPVCVHTTRNSQRR